MALTHDQVTDAINGLVKAAWDAHAAAAVGGTPELVYEWTDRSGIGDVERSADESFARLTVRHDEGNQAALGNKLHRYGGQISAQCFVPYTDGRKPPQAITLGRVVLKAIEGKSVGSMSIVQAKLIEKGQDKSWYRVDVTARFTWYERS